MKRKTAAGSGIDRLFTHKPNLDIVICYDCLSRNTCQLNRSGFMAVRCGAFRRDKSHRNISSKAIARVLAAATKSARKSEPMEDWQRGKGRWLDE